MLAEQSALWDVVVVGGGPAGLSAALVLGRCRRKVVLFDNGQPRNAASHAMHGFLGHDGIAPDRFRVLARQQLTSYPSVTIENACVVDAALEGTGFTVTTGDGRRLRTRKLLLAAGVIDELPDVPGCRELYGIGVFHCPYCDGWEVRDQPLAVYGRGDDKGAGLALEMTLWSSDVVLCSDGPSELSTGALERLRRNGVAVREERLQRLVSHRSEAYQASFDIVFESAPALRRTALFFNTTRRQSTDLAKRLGCQMFTSTGCNIDNRSQATNVHGLYVAGDASRDVLQAVVAAAEGSEAAIAINTALLHEDLA